MGVPSLAQQAQYIALAGNGTAGTAEAFQDNIAAQTLAQTVNANQYLANTVLVNDTAASARTNADRAQGYLINATAFAAAAQVSANAAAASAIASAAARDAATLSAGVFGTVAAGISGTTVGKYFTVPSSDADEALNLYIHDSSAGATKLKSYPTLSGIEYSVNNTFYISGNGSDSNSGTSWKYALRTIEGALAKAWAVANAAVAADPTKGPPVQLIEWAPETIVQTYGHLDMPDNCVVKAVHRTVFVRPYPGFEQRNVFRMGSGCFLEGVMFEGWQVDSLTNPTEGFAVSFRPGAVITRVPYAHKVAVRAIPTWGKIAPPLDVDMGNPLVPRAGGVCLADGNIISQYSIFPNIMTWGATPVLPNGIGYCAKNGALINAVNAVSIWAHKHFMALNGGQIILSACSTQFGDYSMVADGGRNILSPTKSASALPSFTSAGDIACINLLVDSTMQNTVVDDMWTALTRLGYTDTWSSILQTKTKSDAKLLLQCLYWVLTSGNEQPMLDFAKGMFDVNGKPIYISTAKLSVPITEQITTLAVTVQAAPINTSFINQLKGSHTTIIDTMWQALVDRVYVSTWTDLDETYTRRDAETLLTAVEKTLVYANEQYITDFVKGLYYTDGSLAIEYQKLPAVLYSWKSIKTSVLNLSAVGASTGDLYKVLDAIFTALISNFSFKSGVTFNSSSGANATYQLGSQGAFANFIPALTGDILWTNLQAVGYTSYLESTGVDQAYTIRDGNNLLNAIKTSATAQDDIWMTVFGYGLYSTWGDSVIAAEKMPAVLYSFDRVLVETLSYISDNNAKNVLNAIIPALKLNVQLKTVTVAQNTTAAEYIKNSGTPDATTMLNSMWTALKADANVFNSGALTDADERLTKRDGQLFINALYDCFNKGTDQPMLIFCGQLMISLDVCVIAPNKIYGTLQSFTLLGTLIKNKLTAAGQGTINTTIDTLIANLKSNLTCQKNKLPIGLSQVSIDNLKTSAQLIKNNETTIINNVWIALTNNLTVYGTGKLLPADEAITKRDTLTLLTAIESVLNTFSEKPILNFASNMFEPSRVPVINGAKIIPTLYTWKIIKDRLALKAGYPVEITGSMIDNLIANGTLNSNKYAYVFCWDFVKNYVRDKIFGGTIPNIPAASNTLKNTASGLIGALEDNVLVPKTIKEPSRITAIGHTWTSVMGGVALTKIPPANNNATIQDSIVESDDGIVIASGQDDQGNALFVGGLQINSDTGELSGPPFDQAVRRIATKTSISRGF